MGVTFKVASKADGETFYVVQKGQIVSRI